MSICPLCENEQASAESCEVCGRTLAAGPGATRQSSPIEGLEPTLFEAVQGGETARIGSLEATALEPAPALDGDGAAADWVDRTAYEPARADAIERLEIEVTALAADDRVPRDPAAPVVCRYCRRPAAPGAVFCSGCGTKLEVYQPSAPPRQAR